MPPCIDLHCDTLYRLANSPNLFFKPSSESGTHITYPGLCASGTLLQCFAVFTDLCEHPEAPPTSFLKEQSDCFRHILSRSEGQLVHVRTAKELTNGIRQNKTCALLTLEESCLSETPAALLPELYSLGIRMATLTWDYSNLLATAATDAPPTLSGSSVALLNASSRPSGLTPCGYNFVEEAERLGILLDVSHLSDAGFYDLAAHTQKPFLASHSNARAVCNVPRNLSDNMLRILAERGGLAGLCLHEPFLVARPCSAEDISDALVLHVKHILSVAGPDILALGTDFDGTPGNRIIPDITHLHRLENLLEKAGLTTGQIEKIFYQNALRFFTEHLPR